MTKRFYTISSFYLQAIISALVFVGCTALDQGPDCNPWTDFVVNPDTMRFIATGDPQYKAEQVEAGHITVRNSDWIAKKVDRKICEEGYLGYLIAGDLTFYGRLSELEKYRESIKNFDEFVFDGLGNHDFKFVGKDKAIGFGWNKFGLADQFDPKHTDWIEDCYEVWDEVRSRKRIPKINSSYPNINYSFDWEDLHIVQLNAFPGVKPTNAKHAQHPFNSIGFLKQDLAIHVGNSGRPVILIHHYGFDDFSVGIEDGVHYLEKEWWTGKDRDIYWETLRPYNVAAIFTGHAHIYEEWYLPWDGENIGETKVGDRFIPTFVSGAAREGFYLDCQLIEDTLEIKRFNIDTLLDTRKVYVKRGHN